MRVLIAPDKFAGTMSAVDAGEAIAAGWLSTYPDDVVRVIPMADGGPGTVAAVAAATGGAVRTVETVDQRGSEVLAPYLALDEDTVIVEAASACGLHLVPEAERNPLDHDTRGVGILIGRLVGLGTSKVLIGLGGTGTVDGGVGAALALGAQIFGFSGERFERLPPSRFGEMAEVGPIKPIGAEVVAVTDVNNPLLREEGAARVFGPQKGASPRDVEALEAALTHLADVAEAQLPGGPWRDLPGAGAAGGLGFGLMAWLGASVTTGSRLIGELVGLREHVEWADFVVSGEGSMDHQSLSGKAPMEVLTAARDAGKGTGVVVGRIAPGMEDRFDLVEVMGHAGLENPIRAATAAGAVLARRSHTGAVQGPGAESD